MLSAIDKGIKAAEMSRAPAGVYGELDLRVIPKFVSYKAALLREKMGYQYILALVSVLWLLTFLVQNHRIDKWQGLYREKEFILVPSKIIGHTPAVPQTVPKSYISNGISHFITLLGNTTPSDVDERHERFAEYLTPELRSRFLAETAAWREASRTQGIYEQVEITHKEWVPDAKGGFDVSVSLRRDRRVNGDFIGSTQETIKMKLQVVPPQEEKEWIFEIRDFSRRPVGMN